MMPTTSEKNTTENNTAEAKKTETLQNVEEKQSEKKEEKKPKGRPLEAFSGRALTEAWCYAFLEQCCKELSEAHQHDLPHGDLTPEKIYITEKPQLTDIQDLELPEKDAPPKSLLPPESPYNPPEAKEGGRLDGRSDVFSIGVILYTLLTGSPPQTLPPTPLKEARPDREFFDGLEEIIQKALALHPKDRFPSVLHFLTELKEAQDIAKNGVPSIFKDFRKNIKKKFTKYLKKKLRKILLKELKLYIKYLFTKQPPQKNKSEAPKPQQESHAAKEARKEANKELSKQAAKQAMKQVVKQAVAQAAAQAGSLLYNAAAAKAAAATATAAAASMLVKPAKAAGKGSAAAGKGANTASTASTATQTATVAVSAASGGLGAALFTGLLLAFKAALFFAGVALGVIGGNDVIAAISQLPALQNSTPQPTTQPTPQPPPTTQIVAAPAPPPRPSPPPTAAPPPPCPPPMIQLHIDQDQRNDLTVAPEKGDPQTTPFGFCLLPDAGQILLNHPRFLSCTFTLPHKQTKPLFVRLQPEQMQILRADYCLLPEKPTTPNTTPTK